MIKVDTREKHLIQILQNKKIDFNITQLDIGDIHIHNQFSCIVFERKSFVDAIASVKDGRYKEQKIRLLSHQDIIPCYIIENDKVNSDNHILGGMYFNTIFRDRIQICFTNSIDETANLILFFHQKIIDKPDRLINNINTYTSCLKTKSKKIENIDKKTCFILQLSQIPMISTKIASEIADKHSSLNDLIKCLSEWDNPSDYLVTFNGIGKNKADNILNYLL